MLCFRIGDGHSQSTADAVGRFCNDLRGRFGHIDGDDRRLQSDLFVESRRCYYGFNYG